MALCTRIGGTARRRCAAARPSRCAAAAAGPAAPQSSDVGRPEVVARQVRERRQQVGVVARGVDDGQPLLQLVQRDPALGQRLLQAGRGALAVRVGDADPARRLRHASEGSGARDAEKLRVHAPLTPRGAGRATRRRPARRARRSPGASSPAPPRRRRPPARRPPPSPRARAARPAPPRPTSPPGRAAAARRPSARCSYGRGRRLHQQVVLGSEPMKYPPVVR